ncbi:MAG TPA: hypothetical protein VFG83_15860 [Kofleriaceae bacterium]|nr:hypothetical protein [Kofleriaceae bacterium]
MSDRALHHDPLADTDDILSDGFYGSRARPADTPPKPEKTKAKAKPTHYKVVCISLYTKDIAKLERTVAELKRRGYTRANKSQILRYALDQLDLDKLPPPHP